MRCILLGVAWTVEYTDEFELWWTSLTEEQQVALDAMIRILEQHGSALDAPYSVGISTVGLSTLRQLRVPCGEETLCVLYLADEPRTAVVLLAGATGDEDTCPPEQVGEAEIIYRSYLELRKRTKH